ncbi:MAG: hypothetical protein R2827_10140 [Bdellovibrionales bacterium]
MTFAGGFLILDFGSQYTQLIARRLREFRVYSELTFFYVQDYDLQSIKSRNFEGIILSGGPSSVVEEHSPQKCTRTDGYHHCWGYVMECSF